MRFSGRSIEDVGQARVEIDLNEDRHRQHGDDQGLRKNLLALKAEEENQRGKQRHE